MASNNYKLTPEHTDQLKRFFHTHGPATKPEIAKALKWHVERVARYMKVLDCNIVDFVYVPRNGGRGKHPVPRFSLFGEHIGGICEKCGRKMSRVPYQNLKGNNYGHCSDRSMVCASCRQQKVWDQAKLVEDADGEMVYEPEIIGSDPWPTETHPGSEDRVEVLAARVQAGLHLWNPRDKHLTHDYRGFREI